MPNTPNMNLPLSVIGVSSGLQWEQNLNSSLTLVDQHDHSPGKGVPINPASLNINSDLLMNGNNLTIVRSIRFQPQSSALSTPLDIGCLYEAGVDLWYNDGNGTQIQITSGGAVNATSSGISSGTASASFVSSVLVVNAASNTPANIRVASVLLGNNVVGSNYLTLSPPNSMPSNYGLVLPSIPPVISIMALDTAGNITAPYTVDNFGLIISSNIIELGPLGILNANIAQSTITVDKMAPVTVSGTATLGEFMETPSSGTVTSGNTSPTLVPNLSGTLVITGNRPVQITCGSDGSPATINMGGGTSPSCIMYLYVDGSPVQSMQLSGQNVNGLRVGYAASSINFRVNGLSAGTHTFELWFSVSAGSNVTFSGIVLEAYEI